MKCEVSMAVSSWNNKDFNRDDLIKITLEVSTSHFHFIGLFNIPLPCWVVLVYNL